MVQNVKQKEVINLLSPVTKLKGIGPAKAKGLAALGIYTLQDAVNYYPKRYEDRTSYQKIAELVPDEIALISGRIVRVDEVRPRSRMCITKAYVTDGTGEVSLTWFNQRYMKGKLPIGQLIVASGKVKRVGRHLEMNRVSFEPIEEGASVEGAIVPVYGANDAISQKVIRDVVAQSLHYLRDEDVIPTVIAQREGFGSAIDAIREMHFPDDFTVLKKSRDRLAFEELYLIQCGLLLLKAQTKTQKLGVKHGRNGKLVNAILEGLPFCLTGDQEASFRDIQYDMEDRIPMQRLLQGDVGSGKTVIAALALAKTIENGYQGVMMAPTEILAQQHYQTMSEMFASLGVTVELLSGKVPMKKRREILDGLASGRIQLLVGTHALIQPTVVFDALGLVITDEQHRFGVHQRAILQAKSEWMPDVLVMTATPIPRTMALTIYGDLDVSQIKELPPGRKPIRTFVRGEESRQKIYEFIVKQIGEGRQAYIVCPLIEESEKIDVQSATMLYEELSQTVFRNIPCGLLHGRMKGDEKEAVMQAFVNGELAVLIATTVIEVGINVPNATIMVIEGAERFGLSQLHQLRGRIGRGSHQSYCVLVSKGKSEESRERLRAMEETSDGFRLAEIDLEMRGSGQLFGTRQHGLPDLKVANIFRDVSLLLKARDYAQIAVREPSTHQAVYRAIRERYGNAFEGITNN